MVPALRMVAAALLEVADPPFVDGVAMLAVRVLARAPGSEIQVVRRLELAEAMERTAQEIGGKQGASMKEDARAVRASVRTVPVHLLLKGVEVMAFVGEAQLAALLPKPLGTA